MNFSKLSQNEKLAVYGSAAVIIGGLVGYNYGGFAILAVLAAIGLLAVVFLPQFSPNTSLPGTRGSLLAVLGAVAGVVLLLALLLSAGTVFRAFNVRDLFFLIAVAGGLLMAWAGWQELQREGGKFQLGSASSGVAPAAPSAAPAEPAPVPAAAAPPAAPAAQSTDQAPPADAEDRPPA